MVVVTGVDPEIACNRRRPDPLSSLPLDLPLKEARQVWSDRFELHYARAMLAKTNGNVTHAAAQAGVNRRYFQRLLARLSLRGSEPEE